MTIRRVLVVEDNASAQTMLRRMLMRVDPDVRVVCVASAEVAYRTINESYEENLPFDLVIADLNLPASDGLVLKDVSQRHYPHLNFLFVSGVSYEEWFNRISTLGDWPPFLQKPVSEEKLKRFWEDHFVNTETYSS